MSQQQCECGRPRRSPRARKCALCASLTVTPPATPLVNTKQRWCCNFCYGLFRSKKPRRYCSLACRTSAVTEYRLNLAGDLIPKEKTCSACQQVLQPYQFKIDVSRPDGLSTQCRDCLSSKAKAYRERTERRDRVRETNLLRKYGLTLADYERMLAFQNGRCSICGMRPKGNQRRLSVDHDHQTGAIRSLACRQCNQYKIGNLTQDEVEILYRYFHSPPADAALGERRYVPKGMEEPRKRRSPRKRRRSG